MHDDGPTLLFQRNLPGHDERCTTCPFRPASPAPTTYPQPTAYPRPVGTDPTAYPRPVATDLTAYPRPVGTDPAAYPRPVGTDPAAGTYPPRPVLPFPPSAPPAALPRPALLIGEPRGSGTLVLPDALRSAGPDAATIERPSEPGPPPRDVRRDAPRLPGRAARDPDFDELASPDITVLQPSAPTSRPLRPRAPRRAVVPARAYLALNLCLGLLIVAGLVLLATRHAPSTAPSVSASE